MKPCDAIVEGNLDVRVVVRQLSVALSNPAWNHFALQSAGLHRRSKLVVHEPGHRRPRSRPFPPSNPSRWRLARVVPQARLFSSGPGSSQSPPTTPSIDKPHAASCRARACVPARSVRRAQSLPTVRSDELVVAKGTPPPAPTACPSPHRRREHSAPRPLLPCPASCERRPPPAPDASTPRCPLASTPFADTGSCSHCPHADPAHRETLRAKCQAQCFWRACSRAQVGPLPCQGSRVPPGRASRHPRRAIPTLPPHNDEAGCRPR